MLVGLANASHVQYVVDLRNMSINSSMACTHCRMKFAIVCLLIQNILVNVYGNCTLLHTYYSCFDRYYSCYYPTTFMGFGCYSHFCL